MGSPNSFTYAWRRDGKPIAGQSASTYVVGRADLGHSISCAVTASDTGGEYTIPGLVTGAYTVSFGKGETDYLDQYFNDQPTWLTANTVSVVVPSVTAGIDATLGIGGQISGRVTAALDGAPLAGLAVCAYAQEVGGGCASTNADGQYTISGLPSGSYQVEFNRRRALEGDFYDIEYYNGRYSRSEADPVTVTAGSTTADIDAALGPGGQVSGKVTAASSGVSLENVEVCASRSTFEPERPYPPTCKVTNSSGAYTISGLPAGSYLIHFLPLHETVDNRREAGNYLRQYYNGKTQWSEADPVTVARGVVVTGIDATLQTGGQISGRVTAAAGGAPLAGIVACVEGGEACAVTDANGNYMISGVAPGPRYVSFSSREGGNYLTQYYNGKSSRYEAEGVNVLPGSITSGIDAAMDAAGQITGRVTDAATMAPLANVQVCAWGGSSQSCSHTDEGGQYTLSGLQTGSYGVEFRTYEGDDHTPLRLSGVLVTAGDTTGNVNAAMNPGGKISGRVTDASSGAGIANIEVCVSDTTGNERVSGCTTTNAAGGSASAMSNSLSVPAPNSTFKMLRRVFNAKRGEIDLSVEVFNPGLLQWKLFFNNADVGFTASASFASSHARSAAVAKRKGKACAKGRIKHRGRCVAKLAPLAGGSQTVAGAGTVELRLRVSAKVLRVLRGPGALHVSGTLSFQSAFGGAPSSQRQSFTVRGPKRHKKGSGKRH